MKIFILTLNVQDAQPAKKICLSERIKLVDGKPQWDKKIICYHCIACINYCPVESIQISKKSENCGRYPHPYATLDDIASQKHLEEF